MNILPNRTVKQNGIPKLEASLRKADAIITVHRFPQPENSFFKRQKLHKIIETVASQSRVSIKFGKGRAKLGSDAAMALLHLLPAKTVRAFVSRLYNPDLQPAQRTIYPSSDVKIKVVVSDVKLAKPKSTSMMRSVMI
jgi:hypothetical protein